MTDIIFKSSTIQCVNTQFAFLTISLSYMEQSLDWDLSADIDVTKQRHCTISVTIYIRNIIYFKQDPTTIVSIAKWHIATSMFEWYLKAHVT